MSHERCLWYDFLVTVTRPGQDQLFPDSSSVTSSWNLYNSCEIIAEQIQGNMWRWEDYMGKGSGKEWNDSWGWNPGKLNLTETTRGLRCCFFIHTFESLRTTLLWYVILVEHRRRGEGMDRRQGRGGERMPSVHSLNKKQKAQCVELITAYKVHACFSQGGLQV